MGLLVGAAWTSRKPADAKIDRNSDSERSRPSATMQSIEMSMAAAMRS